jgi:hypothetical protein
MTAAAGSTEASATRVQPRSTNLSPARRRRLITLGLLRSLATTVVLVVLYYLRRSYRRDL